MKSFQKCSIEWATIEPWIKTWIFEQRRKRAILKHEDAAAKALADYVFESENYPWDSLEDQHTGLTLFGNLGL